jgi:hypothetical protein
MLQWFCWRQMHARASECGEESYALLFRLTIRYWPGDTLTRLVQKRNWHGAARKRAAQVLVARVREEYEARRPDDPRWEILLAGTVRLVWECLCERWLNDEAARKVMRGLSEGMARDGIEPL